MTVRERLEAARSALQQGDPLRARDLLDAVLDGTDHEGLPADQAPMARVTTVRLLVDVTPRQFEAPSRPVDRTAPPVWGVDVVGREPTTGVALARGHGVGQTGAPIAEGFHALGRALASDAVVLEALARAQAVVERTARG